MCMTVGVLTLCVCSCNKKKQEENASEPSGPKSPEKTGAQQDRLDIPESPKDGGDEPRGRAKSIAEDMAFDTPEQLAERFGQLVQQADGEKDLEKIMHFFANAKISTEQKQQLQRMMEGGEFAEAEVLQIGEMDHGKRSRWVVRLKGDRAMTLDLTRQANGKWGVESIQFPADSVKEGGHLVLPDAAVDELNFTHTFLQHLIRQDFEKAKAMSAGGNVNDAQLAGLCILFEEAAYKLRKEKPLRAMFEREKAAGFYVNVESGNGENTAQFSVIIQRAQKGEEWRVHELNLDALLSDYAKRMAGGDVYFTPLVKNPKGGETLVIYFDFASNDLAERTKKQLDIVAGLLKVDGKKTINLSGHTDSVGGQDFNQGLSKDRAQAVKKYLIEQGVGETQILTEAHGFEQPRRPNTRSDGSDDPLGRRANRRTEIYLDF